MAIMTALALVPPILEGDTTRDDGGSTLSIVFYWALPYAVLGLAILFTVKYPEWFGAEFDNSPAVAGKTQPPIPTTADDDHSRAGDAVLDATPQQALVDEPIAVTMHGLAPGSTVALTATNVDLAGNVWRSTASFRADASGRIDTASAAPVAGDYAGVDADGLIWSMRFSTEGATPDIYVPPPGASAVAIEAATDGVTLTKTLVRRSGAAGVSVRDVRNTIVVGRLFLPPGDGPFPGVALFGGSEGWIDSEYSNAALFASHGFAALTVGYFGLDEIERAARLHTARTARRRCPHARRRPARRHDARRHARDLAWIGRCPEHRGATRRRSACGDRQRSRRLACPGRQWATKARCRARRRGPSPVRRCHISTSPTRCSWTRRSATRSAIEASTIRITPTSCTWPGAYATALEDTAGADVAAIPVERITAPLLLLSGSDDQVWPSGPMADAILARRQGAESATGDHHQRYEGGGHLLRLGCMPTDVTATSGIALGGTRVGIAAAQSDATTRILEFFRSTLG